MSERFPPDDDPIIRSLRDQGVRPLHPGRGPLGGRSRTTVGGRNRGFVIAAFLVLLLLIFIPAIVQRLSDWLWFDEIGFEHVFLTKIVAQWTLGIIWGAI